MRRVVIPELLDTDSGSAEEVRRSFEDLALINDIFGGNRLTCKLLNQVAQFQHLNELTFLDVGGGTGQFAQTVKSKLKSDRLNLFCTVLDRVPAHLRSGSTHGNRVAANAVQLPFLDRSYDVVGSNLFCHHLEPEEIVRFLEEALRVSKIAVIINDLRRNYLHWLLSYAGFVMYRSRLTRHDAPASVRRAYTVMEMRSFAERTRASRITTANFYFQRMGVILWR